MLDVDAAERRISLSVKAAKEGTSDYRAYMNNEGAGRASGFKSHGAEGKSFSKAPPRAKPSAPKTDAKDTSKRFVPPKRPKV